MCMTRKKETHKVSLKDFDDARKIWETVHREVIILVENGWEVLLARVIMRTKLEQKKQMRMCG